MDGEFTIYSIGDLEDLINKIETTEKTRFLDLVICMCYDALADTP